MDQFFPWNQKSKNIDRAFTAILLLIIYLILLFTLTEVLIIKTFFNVSQFNQQLISSSRNEENYQLVGERGEIFYISSKNDHFPQFFNRLIINPFYGARSQEKQYFFIWAKDPQGIEKVVVIIDPNKKGITIPFRLVEGDKFSGKWVGYWIVKDFPKSEAVDLLFEAKNTKGEITHLKTYFHFLKSEHSESFLLRFKELFVPMAVEAATQCPLPVSGNTTISSDCYIPQGERTGVESGDLIIKATITMERNSSLVFNPGKSVIISGEGYILKSANNTSVRKGHLVICDDECSPGEQKCRGYNLYQCKLLGGCYRWKLVEGCSFDCGAQCRIEILHITDDVSIPVSLGCKSAGYYCRGNKMYFIDYYCQSCTCVEDANEIGCEAECGAECDEGETRSYTTCDGKELVRVTETCNDNCIWKTTSQKNIGCDYRCGAECKRNSDCGFSGFDCNGSYLVFRDFWCDNCDCKEDISNLGCDIGCGAECESDSDCKSGEYCKNCVCQSIGGGGGCFTGDTLISTPTGSRPIGDIKKGDIVLSFDIDSGKILPREVVRTTVHTDFDYFKLSLADGATLKVTWNHLLYVKDAKGKTIWLQAKDVVPGMWLLNQNLEWVRVEKRAQSQEKITVYNFELDQAPNNYFANGYLVHNIIKF